MTLLIAIIIILSLLLALAVRKNFVYQRDLRMLRSIHLETCEKLEKAQSAFLNYEDLEEN